jgi:hypothetical protein
MAQARVRVDSLWRGATGLSGGLLWRNARQQGRARGPERQPRADKRDEDEQGRGARLG